MDRLTLGIIAFPLLFFLLGLRFPIGLAMLIVGATGTAMIAGFLPVLSQMKTSAWHLFSSYSLTVIPLFLLMGNFAGRAGMSAALFRFAGSCLGHRRGGVAMAAVGACAGFGAICGSSLATAATMGKVALPELRKMGYSPALSTGALAAGGTLGILIPPSVILIIYSIMTEQNIAKMFLAAFIPGFLAAIGYMITIALYVRFYPEAGPKKPYVGMKERFFLFLGIWPIILIFSLVIGGIYIGWFTPTEGAAIGAAGTGFLAVIRSDFDRNDLITVIEDTAVTSAMIFLVLLGAEFFNSFLALTQITTVLSDTIGLLDYSPYLVIALILVIYLFLGCIMDSLAMILLTIPIFFPLVMALDLNLNPEEVAIWFGILTLIVVETGLITPPVGLNAFIINKIAGDIPLTETFSGVIPFLLSDIIRVIILFCFPSITLFLVRWMYS
mgnify:CR=1 FL=1